MSEITIPPEAIEAAARAYAVANDTPELWWPLYEEKSRAAIRAALAAWPGMEQRTSGHHPRGIGGPGEVVTRRIILPLPQESTNAET